MQNLIWKDVSNIPDKNFIMLSTALDNTHTLYIMGNKLSRTFCTHFTEWPDQQAETCLFKTAFQTDIRGDVEAAKREAIARAKAHTNKRMKLWQDRYALFNQERS